MTPAPTTPPPPLPSAEGPEPTTVPSTESSPSTSVPAPEPNGHKLALRSRLKQRTRPHGASATTTVSTSITPTNVPSTPSPPRLRSAQNPAPAPASPTSPTVPTPAPEEDVKPVIDVDADADADADADMDEGNDAGGAGVPTTAVNSENTTSDGDKAVKPPSQTKDTPGSKPSSRGGVEGRTDAADEYEAGRVVCEDCGGAVPIRDGDGKDGDNKGGFTTKHWEAHKTVCPALNRGSADPTTYGLQNRTNTPHGAHNGSHSTHAHSHSHPSSFAHLSAHSLSHPGPHSAHHHSIPGPAPTHPKRRRAKRTEDERIAYLRSDPYVAKFEAYRVLCASCDKWIRLRPNSTYCSIPWDAHRKSCLAKKINNKNVYALDERNTLFAKDPDVRKFDPERLLCNMCDKWLALPADDHLQAVQKWLTHRAACQRQSGAGAPTNGAHAISAGRGGNASGGAGGAKAEGEAKQELEEDTMTYAASSGPASASHHHHGAHPQTQGQGPHSPRGAPSLSPSSSHGHGHQHLPPSTSAPLHSGHGVGGFHSLTPTTYAPAHESRRRNAEQRAATLRADPLIGVVEENRVFCSLCEKWVQLRQDSSFCAYPWLQHRGKCMARHHRRTQKAAEMADVKAQRRNHPAALHPAPQHQGYPPHGAHPEHGHPYPSHAHYAQSAPHQHHQQRGERHHSRHGHGYPQGPPLTEEDELLSASEMSHSDAEDGEAANARRGHVSGHRHGDKSDVEGEEDDGVESEEGAGSAPPSRKRRHTIATGEDARGEKRRKLDARYQERYRPSRAQQQGHPSAYTHSHQHQHPNPHAEQHQYAHNGGKARYPNSPHLNGANGATNPSMSRAVSSAAAYRGQAQGRRASHSTNGYPQKRNGSPWVHTVHDVDGDLDPDADADAEGEVDADGEGEVDADGEAEGPGNGERMVVDDGDGDIVDGMVVLGGDGSRRSKGGRGSKSIVVRRESGMYAKTKRAELDSPAGRSSFIADSVFHLFSTTYSPGPSFAIPPSSTPGSRRSPNSHSPVAQFPGDELTISSLLTYLNAAVPPDCYEDFDTREVARAVSEMARKGKVVLEGDVLRLV